MVIKSRALRHRAEQHLTHYFAWWGLLAIVLFSAVIRFRLLNIPLQRDEGEYAYAGQLILQGIPPYQQLYNMKLPGVYAIYAVILGLFGQSPSAIHFGLLLINAATIVLVFLLAKRVIGPLAGVVAAGSFAVLSLGKSVQGLSANAEHFVLLPALGGVLLLLWALDDNRPLLILLSGLLLGLGFLMKQHGAAFVGLGGLYLVIDQMRKRPVDWPRLGLKCALFTTGVLVPYGLTCLALELTGVLGKFWFWTVEYAISYSSQMSVDHAWAAFKEGAMNIGGTTPLIWILAGMGAFAIMWDKQIRRKSIFIVTFFMFSLAAICPAFYFRGHYFLLIMPAASLLAGIAIRAAVNMLSSLRYRAIQYGLPIVLAVICLAVSVYQQRRLLFQMTPIEACREIYGLNPFPESVEIGRFIRAHTKESDRIGVIGSEPEIYFYSRRRSATAYIYVYALMENHVFAGQMQKEMIQQIESSRPEFLVFVWINTSWKRRPESQRLLLEWFPRYQAEHYTLVGLVDLLNGAVQYQWVPNVKWPPRSPSWWIGVLKRKG